MIRTQIKAKKEEGEPQGAPLHSGGGKKERVQFCIKKQKRSALGGKTIRERKRRGAPPP